MVRVRSLVILPALHWIRAHCHRHDPTPCPCEHVDIRIGANGQRIAHIGIRIDRYDWIIANIPLDGYQPDHAPERDSYDCG